MSGRAPFSPGDKHIGADFLNDLDRARRQAGVGADHTVGTSDSRITVLLTVKPTNNDRTLKVRRVRYSTARPEECEGTSCHYEFSSAVFDAYPDFGKKITDYEGDEWSGPLITDEDTFLKAYKESGSWRIEKPPATAAEIDYCVILQTSTVNVPDAFGGTEPWQGDPALGSWLLRVQRVHLGSSGQYEAKGKPMIAGTRPNVRGNLYDDYRRHHRNGLTTGPIGNPNSSHLWLWQRHENMVTFQVMKSDGIWIVEQPPPLVTRAFPNGTAAGCSTV